MQLTCRHPHVYNISEHNREGICDHFGFLLLQIMHLNSHFVSRTMYMIRNCRLGEMISELWSLMFMELHAPTIGHMFQVQAQGTFTVQHIRVSPPIPPVRVGGNGWRYPKVCHPKTNSFLKPILCTTCVHWVHSNYAFARQCWFQEADGFRAAYLMLVDNNNKKWTYGVKMKGQDLNHDEKTKVVLMWHHIPTKYC